MCVRADAADRLFVLPLTPSTVPPGPDLATDTHSAVALVPSRSEPVALAPLSRPSPPTAAGGIGRDGVLRGGRRDPDLRRPSLSRGGSTRTPPNEAIPPPPRAEEASETTDGMDRRDGFALIPPNPPLNPDGRLSPAGEGGERTRTEGARPRVLVTCRGRPPNSALSSSMRKLQSIPSLFNRPRFGHSGCLSDPDAGRLLGNDKADWPRKADFLTMG
mmetsp:Transcript_27390/g.53767  ORF Transcript_27390/g.53767 Transcript_27390/m.53767 type:complete len:217 (-) Transcript_27390:1116-1766(-)